MKILTETLLLLIVLYICLCLYMFLRQRRFIFYPVQTRHQDTPAGTRPFSLQNNTATLRGWLINPDFRTRRLIIYYGGNGEDVYNSIDQFRSYEDTATLLLNYRGYGISEGTPGEKELFSDALAAFDVVTANRSEEKGVQIPKIFVMGRSLGSGVAAYVAANRKVDGIILVTPFSSLTAVAGSRYPLLPVSLLLQHRFPSEKYAKDFTAPSLVLYGGKDRTVPPSDTEKLLQHIAGPTKVIYIESAEHNNIEMFDEYQLAVLQFLHPESASEDNSETP